MDMCVFMNVSCLLILLFFIFQSSIKAIDVLEQSRMRGDKNIVWNKEYLKIIKITVMKMYTPVLRTLCYTGRRMIYNETSPLSVEVFVQTFL